MREILKGERNDRAIAKALLCVLSFFMVLGFMPMDVHAAANPAFLTVNGTDILTASDNVVQCGSGTAKYDGNTNTLTLTNATINQIDSNNCAIRCSGGSGDLTIELIGTNAITSTDRGIYTHEVSLNFKGNGSLTLNTTGDVIQADSSSDIVIDGCTVNVTSSNYNGIKAYDGTLTIKNGANITVDSVATSLVAKNGIIITDSYVDAKTSGNTSTVFYSTAGKIDISNSTVKAATTGYYAIYSSNTLNVTNGSDVIADGRITAVNGLTVTPASGSLVEFKAGSHENGEQGAAHIGNSPYSEEFSFTNNDIAGYTYIHIKDHTHTGNPANCVDKAICTDCGNSYGDINPNNHKNLTKTDAKSATHLEDGNIEYYYCDGCGKYFRDKDGTEEISLEDTVVSKTTEHTVDNTGWHSDENSHWNTCECGEILNKTSHTFKWVIDKEATSNEKGSKHEECEICGFKKASVEILATGTKPNDKTDNSSNNGNTAKPSSTDKTSKVKTNSPKTGDNTYVGLYTSLLAVSGLLVAILAVLVLRKKKAFGHK